jgi:hypothetical protein
MPDQSSDPSDSGDQPADDSRDPVERPAEPTPFAETLRAKLEEYGVEGHLESFAAQLEHVVRQGMETVGSLAHEHRDDIGGFLSRTAEALDRRTDGRHAETISEVRGQLERGMERLAQQRGDDAGTTWPTDPAGPTGPSDPARPSDPAGPSDPLRPSDPSDPSDPARED